MCHKPELISGNQMRVWKLKRQQQCAKIRANPQSVPQMRLKFANKQIIPIRVRHTVLCADNSARILLSSHSYTHTNHHHYLTSAILAPVLLSGCLFVIPFICTFDFRPFAASFLAVYVCMWGATVWQSNQIIAPCPDENSTLCFELTIVNHKNF